MRFDGRLIGIPFCRRGRLAGEGIIGAYGALRCGFPESAAPERDRIRPKRSRKRVPMPGETGSGARFPKQGLYGRGRLAGEGGAPRDKRRRAKSRGAWRGSERKIHRAKAGNSGPVCRMNAEKMVRRTTGGPALMAPFGTLINARTRLALYDTEGFRTGRSAQGCRLIPRGAGNIARPGAVLIINPENIRSRFTVERKNRNQACGKVLSGLTSWQGICIHAATRGDVKQIIAKLNIRSPEILHIHELAEFDVLVYISAEVECANVPECRNIGHWVQRKILPNKHNDPFWR